MTSKAMIIDVGHHKAIIGILFSLYILFSPYILFNFIITVWYGIKGTCIVGNTRYIGTVRVIAVYRLGSSTSVLVLKSALSTFSKVLGCAYKHFINQSLCACACALFGDVLLKHF